ncbi:hypothetical protein [Streptomyces sp. PT12]|uniref:hypothetical protein n=1 Tax=Streptomyces sp. PT12 TaxID=1510197 RepID=UPI0011BED980|nr:hypothetical protein [Streptomyces sp. PT12]
MSTTLRRAAPAKPPAHRVEPGVRRSLTGVRTTMSGRHFPPRATADDNGSVEYPERTAHHAAFAYPASERKRRSGQDERGAASGAA